MSAGERERLSALPVRRQVTSISYARLLLPDLLSDRSGLLLYIDSDTIVNRSLRPLVETELGDYALAAVPDGPEKFVTWRNRVLGRAPDAPYFNAGVQLINLVQWRQLRLGETSLAFAEANPAIVDWADQDSLNIVIGANWTPLPHVWNWCTESGAPGSFELAHIIHFTSRLKPNDRACEHPAKALYLQHRANTPWRAKTSEISRIG
jgi:lipopolysaccharide biosynthesis glycosyltransferase